MVGVVAHHHRYKPKILRLEIRNCKQNQHCVSVKASDIPRLTGLVVNSQRRNRNLETFLRLTPHLLGTWKVAF